MKPSPKGERLSPPRRVQIVALPSHGTGYFKPGQFGYARVKHTSGGFHTLDAGVSRPGQVVYGISKSRDGRGVAVWLTEGALRFTGHRTSKQHATAPAPHAPAQVDALFQVPRPRRR